MTISCQCTFKVQSHEIDLTLIDMPRRSRSEKCLGGVFKYLFTMLYCFFIQRNNRSLFPIGWRICLCRSTMPTLIWLIGVSLKHKKYSWEQSIPILKKADTFKFFKTPKFKRLVDVGSPRIMKGPTWSFCALTHWIFYLVVSKTFYTEARSVWFF